jgi:hypothetical protein
MVLIACSPLENNQPSDLGEEPGNMPSIEIPIGGNTWVSGGIQLSETGISKWQEPSTHFSTWFSVNKPGSLHMSLKGSLNEGQSELRISMAGQQKDIVLEAGPARVLNIGSFEIDQPGYLEVKVEALNKSAADYGEFSDWIIAGEPINAATAFVPNNEGNAFYWTRRGPSVHLRYETAPEDQEIEWYYGEIEVPVGNDVLGSYFMAHGFNGGYFGFQVNSENERRILFSVWSPYQTDNPGEIPEEDRIQLHAKGRGVYTGEFGNEGSGGQSFLRYMWQAGKSYKFLLQGKPLDNDYTRYTAWFYAIEEEEWRLIASFDRPKTNSYLKGWYSFLENFNPETGPITRMAFYKNQWYRNAGSGSWKPISRARFTADNTARQNWRSDYAGGVQGAMFFLKNCGFFFPPISFDQDFERELSTVAPVIDLKTLPMQ